MKKNIQDGWARFKLAHFFMRDLQDVDVSTTLPAGGQVLVWNSTDHKWEPGGGFDPNEDPVIIGSGAGTATSTPDHPRPADSGSVILGLNAFGPGIAIGNAASAGTVSGIAIGNAADTTTNGVAIGPAAGVRHSEGIAIGLNASTGSTSNGANIAIGSGAAASKVNSVAIGTGATTGTWSNSVALGQGATATNSNQIMLGTPSETVVMPGSFDGSHLPTVAPFAGSGLVWNNAGVLTVA